MASATTSALRSPKLSWHFLGSCQAGPEREREAQSQAVCWSHWQTSLHKSLSFPPSAQAGQWALKRIKKTSSDGMYPGGEMGSSGRAQNTARDTDFLPHRARFRLSFIQRQPRLTGDVRLSPVICLWLQKLHYTLSPTTSVSELEFN